MIRVLLVDDSLTVRKRIAQILERVSDMTVCGECRNGKEAIEETVRLKPHVILMDIVMPLMNGTQAVEYLMAHRPTPVVILSSSQNRGDTYRTWDALRAGAVAAIEKVGMEEGVDEWEKNLIQTLRAASRMGRTRKRKMPAPALMERWKAGPARPVSGRFSVVAFGCSTGGPLTIARILGALPGDLPVPILLVMHISETMSTFPLWLQDQCGLKTAFAVHDQPLEDAKGRVLVAPAERHTVVENRRIRLLDSPPMGFCRPSVDALFLSLAREAGGPPIAALLTGMGQDGAMGLKAIRESGGYTICQDQKTSIIFGMPKAGIELDAAVDILPEDRIAQAILKRLGRLQDLSFKS